MKTMQTLYQSSTDAEQPLSPLEYVAQMRPLLDEYAAACEQEGRIADPVLAALKASGLFRLTTAKRAGGAGAPVRELVEVAAEIAKSCPGTGWAFGILAAATGTAASLPPAQTESVFRRGDELVCFVGAKGGVATPVEGGFRVSGEWRYGSGCLHADWAMCRMRMESPEGALGTAFIDFADTSHVEIVHDWLVCGLSGSGSNQIKVRDHFVPANLMMPDFVTEPEPRPASADDREPRDFWPNEIQFPLTVLPPMLGAAQGLLAAVQSKMTSRAVLNWKYPHQSDSQLLLAMLGEAAMKIDSAWLHIRRVCTLMDEVAPVRPVTQMEKIKAQAECAYAMRLVREASNMLMDIAGPAGFATANSMQRFWRDINVGTRHNALNAGFSLELLGRAMTGQKSNLDIIPEFET